MKIKDKLQFFQNSASKKMEFMDLYQKLETFIVNNDILSLFGIVNSNSTTIRDVAKNEKRSLMNLVAKSGNKEMAKILLKNGFKFDKKDVRIYKIEIWSKCKKNRNRISKL